ncbi:major facilitator superfamily domain-containing protein [Suillus subalutaceus]|uniref:major facilitator superfamily domain-containing protein n=1 Tax=Suillus subalutaceus TaxID=48586 RepID=UPI001B8736EA|nr:major facilitator superfamily domain-containing protein [Suillus subalutaceus]KAG1848757.1 major facilitator superfamily domain-containing protein [Suillus subalutaceus]
MDTSKSHEIIANETAPLLPAKGSKKPKTPLPKLQIGILITLQLSEPIASTSIFPYINQLIRELGITEGNDAAVGYYAGIIVSARITTCEVLTRMALMVLRWSRLSDRIGRKPMLIMGLSGACISILCFGLSTTFWSLVISRCMCGFLNGNVGVMKTMMGELTDSTNMAQVFALIPIVWSFGGFLGGSISARPGPCYDDIVLRRNIVNEASTEVHFNQGRCSNLGFDPTAIGKWMALFEIIDGVFQALFFPIIVDWIASAPTNNVLGTINGLGQTSAAMARAVGPAMATSALRCIEGTQPSRRNAVFVILIVLASGLRWLASQLPDEVQDRDE